MQKHRFILVFFMTFLLLEGLSGQGFLAVGCAKQNLPSAANTPKNLSPGSQEKEGVSNSNFCMEIEEAYYRGDLHKRYTPPELVFALLERYILCVHLGGEEPYDEERAEDLQDTIQNQKCLALETDAKHLREKYRGDPSALRLLACVEGVFN